MPQGRATVPRITLSGTACILVGSVVFARTELKALMLGPRIKMESSAHLREVVDQAAQGDATPTYPETSEGFTAQVTAAMDAYQKGDAAAGRHLLEQFRLPHSADWLGENIAPEQSEALAERYDHLFASYLNGMENTMEELARMKGANLVSNLRPATQDPPRIDTTSSPTKRKLTGIVPVKTPVCFNGHFSSKLTSKGHTLLTGYYSATMWLDTFIYQDGAFRFVGRGGWPFWVVDDGSAATATEGDYVRTPLDSNVETVDEVVPYKMDQVVAALKPAMEKEDCKVVQEKSGQIECKRPRHTGNNASGGESVTATLEAQGDQTHVHISTGKGYYGRLVKRNWSYFIYDDMLKALRNPQP
jgi:hypothetical protein